MVKKKGQEKLKILEQASIDDDVYDRQKRIKGWDQKKISNASVMVIGAGATGNEVVKNLVLTGIGKIILIDFDFINVSNLNRCVLFNIKSAEKKEYKADVVKEACKDLNPDVEIVALKEDLNDIDKKYYQCDVICSCVDNVEARIQANNYAFYYNVPFVDSGIDEFYGSVQAVYSGVSETACLQCGISNVDLDLMWTKFSCTGGIQAQQVLKFILGIDSFKENGEWNPYIGNPLIGQQLNYNGHTNKFDIIKKLKNPNCILCSYKKKK